MGWAYHWNTPRHADENNCRYDHDEEDDPEDTPSSIASLFDVIGYYRGLWAKKAVSFGKVTRPGS